MSKYDPLGDYLKAQHGSEVPMTFAEIESVVGTKLPPSAYRHRPWWSNNATNSVMTKVWLNAGFEASRVDLQARKLVFRRIAREAREVSGMSEAYRAFEPAPVAKSDRRSPLFGCMKGTFTIEPGYDLTSPMFTDEEWEEIEKEMEEDWDQIDQGMKGRK
jgi:hypothetical protein